MGNMGRKIRDVEASILPSDKATFVALSHVAVIYKYKATCCASHVAVIAAFKCVLLY